MNYISFIHKINIIYSMEKEPQGAVTVVAVEILEIETGVVMEAVDDLETEIGTVIVVTEVVVDVLMEVIAGKKLNADYPEMNISFSAILVFIA